MNFILLISHYFENKAFGVCEWWGQKLGLPAKRIRMYFVYLSFFTVGSPIIIYFIMAFVLEHKNYFTKPPSKQRSSIWEI